jgi:hypothetical protein
MEVETLINPLQRVEVVEILIKNIIIEISFLHITSNNNVDIPNIHNQGKPPKRCSHKVEDRSQGM